MANWGNVKIGFGKDAKVTSHERVEDTDPETYCYRGLHFSEQGKYIEAEKEYLKAVKFSGNNDSYVEKLLSFYYSTYREDFKQKANRLFSDWWWRRPENQFYFYLFMFIICLSAAMLVHDIGVVSTLILNGPIVLLLQPWNMGRKSFIDKARGTGEIRQAVLILVGFVWLGIVTVLVLGNNLTGNWFESLGIMLLISKIIAIGCMIGCMISFYKVVKLLKD